MTTQLATVPTASTGGNSTHIQLDKNNDQYVLF